jgi:uncharacterized repeat protein (TIGR03803 family)
MKNIIIVVLALCTAIHAQPPRVYTLHNFNGTTEGKTPEGALITDQNGNLYGVTQTGGGKNATCYQNVNNGCGTVFELIAPAAPGDIWRLQTLYRFTGGSDGSLPSAGLIMDAQGNLYGTTYAGGDMTNSQCRAGGKYIGCGTVFELSQVQGVWTETVLHNFEYVDGWGPEASVIFDSQGNLYGTTEFGGAQWGTVFELSGGPNWTETVLDTFTLPGDGANPMGNLIFDGLGNLYGTTYAGGTGGYGTVFELSPSAQGWTETVLINFTGSMSSYPTGGLIFDASGNLYGTSSAGGQGMGYCPAGGCGSVFELSPSDGSWTETVLFDFDQGNSAFPRGNLTADPAGNLYGTSGGRDCGSVFRLLNETWQDAEIDLFARAGKPCGPNTPTFGKFAGLYASSTEGGVSKTCNMGCGTVFAVYQ